jgi:hypothetical protein
MQRRKRSRFDNLLVVVPASIVALTLVGLVAFNIWFGLFSIAISWVVADFALSLFIRGGGRIVQLPPVSGTQTVTPGRAYLGFLIAIFIVTLLGSISTDWLFRIAGFTVSSVMGIGVSLPPAQIGPLTILLCSGLVGVLVFFDLKARFYKRAPRM